jgi:hypothetical protein
MVVRPAKNTVIRCWSFVNLVCRHQGSRLRREATTANHSVGSEDTPLSSSSLRSHGVRTLEPGVGLLGVRADGASLHRLSPLHTAHVVALDAVGTVRILLLIITVALDRASYAICWGISLVGVLARGRVAVVGCISVGCAASVAHHVVEVTGGCCLALGSRVS